MRSRLPTLLRRLATKAAESPEFQKPVYFDPAASHIDFSKPNRQIYAKIENDSRDRLQKRLEEPAREWLENHPHFDDLQGKMQLYIEKARVSLNLNLAPLSIGDLVLLNTQSTIPHIVVEVPQLLDQDTYTFVNSEGEIKYGTKHHIQLRIPKVIPQEFIKSLDLIVLERKHKGIAPIGMPDKYFSRLAEALPHGVASEDSNSLGSAMSNVGDDFIVAQATSQLLTDTDVKTFIVPGSGRRVISDFLTDLSIKAYLKVSSFTKKLDYFHRVLQYDGHNKLEESSRTLPVFELFKYVSNFDETKHIIREVKGKDGEYRKVNSFIRRIALDPATGIGKSVPPYGLDSFADSSHSLLSYIAFILALERSNRRWKINMQKSSKTPISVEILYVGIPRNMQEVITYFKTNGTAPYAQWYDKFLRGLNPREMKIHKSLKKMARDYVASNIAHDHTMESTISSLLRNVKIPNVNPFCHEYGRCRAFEFLHTFDQEWTNPIKWMNALGLPKMGTSIDSDSTDALYTLLDSMGPQFVDVQSEQQVIEHWTFDFFDNLLKELLEYASVSNWIKRDFFASDPVLNVRESFSEPVYCIDSPTAHEIDDGISIQELEDKYRFTVHVANPTSYIKRDSDLSQAAFGKGVTTYLPEGAYMMLPKVISQLCGLVDSDKRTLAIEFEMSKVILNDFIVQATKDPSAKPSKEASKRVWEDIGESANVRFCTVSNVKGLTYDGVNSMLEEGANDTDTANLSKLYHASLIFKHIRLTLGEGLDFNTSKSKISVDYVDESVPTFFSSDECRLTIPNKSSGKTPLITIKRDTSQNADSKSQALVSNMMIFGNYAGSLFAHRNSIPIVHRTQEMNLSKDVKRQISKLNMKSYVDEEALTAESFSKLLSVLTGANYEVSRKKHESLGLESYLNFTSPLRRYVDMVNHWNIQEFYGEKKYQQGLDYVASHLRGREYINKVAQTFSERFWSGTLLRFLLEEQKPALSFLLRSDAKFGHVVAEVIGFRIKTLILQNEFVTGQFASGAFKVGHVITTSAFSVVKLDYIDGELVIEMHGAGNA